MIKKICKILIIIVIILIVIFVLFKILKVQDELKKIIYKTDYSEFVEKYSNEYNLDKNLVYALIKAESNFKTDAVSNKGAMGLMQLMEATAKDITQKMNLELDKKEYIEPENNIKMGCYYLSQLMQKYNNNYILAITAYNAGTGTVDTWLEKDIIKSDGSDIENIPYKETNIYVRKIIRDYKVYQNTDFRRRKNGPKRLISDRV